MRQVANADNLGVTRNESHNFIVTTGRVAWQQKNRVGAKGKTVPTRPLMLAAQARAAIESIARGWQLEGGGLDR